MKRWIKNRRKIIIIIGVIAVLVLASILIGRLYLWITFNDMAGNSIIEEVYSPNNQYKAVIFERDAGGTTGFSTQISILPSNDFLPNKAGNTFISDTNHGKVPAEEWGGLEVKVLWNSPNEIEIWYNKNTRVFKSRGSIKGVKVIYKTIN